MIEELLFSAELGLQVVKMMCRADQLTIFARRIYPTAVCPCCQVRGNRVHSIYSRWPMDVPCFGKRVYHLCLLIHRFFCDNIECGQRTFAEQFPGLIKRKTRRTERVMSQHQQIAFALGGEAGQRLCEKLGIPISADTLIGAIRQAGEPKVSTPRVLGVDDWAKRKGHAYGTILVDLETHCPIDLLDSRTAEAVSQWLQTHPGVEIVSRDRGTEYIKGVTTGAPDAVQVADRWHLLKNLREVVETFLEEKLLCLQAAAHPPLAMGCSKQDTWINGSFTKPIQVRHREELPAPS